MMLRRVLLIAFVAGCGGRKEKPAGAPPPPPPQAAVDGGVAGCAAGELKGERGCERVPGLDGRAALLGAAEQLDGIAKVLRDNGSLPYAAQVLETLHASRTWKKLAAAEPGLRPVDVAALAAASDKLDALGRELIFAAGELRRLHDELDGIATSPGATTLREVRSMVSTRVAAVFGARGTAVGTTIRDVISPLVDPLVDEIVFLRDHVCAKPDASTRAACEKQGVLQPASAYLEKARSTTRQDFDAAGGSLRTALAGLLDEATTTTIDRATGRGPGPGEPCGKDDLCSWGLTCRHVGGAPAGTCERTCHEAAMEPCPAGLACRTLPDLGPVCRP